VTQQNTIVILKSGKPNKAALQITGQVVRSCSDYREFRQSGIEPSAVVLRGDDEHYNADMLHQLRRDPEFSGVLAFIDGPASDVDLEVADGPLPSTEAAILERIDRWTNRANAIRRNNDNCAPDAKLLEFMWLRPGYVLEPFADWQHARRWRYPLLEALDCSDSDPDTWIHRLDKNALIERVALRDRQRECDFCGSGHLSFIDVCPSCRSIEIDRHSALHCFSCGLVAPEVRFIRGDMRQCPKCGTRLRHIGSDYDRPLETNACLSCEHVFIEGDVEARCAVCRHTMATTRLRLRTIQSWRLSGLGCLAAQSGATDVPLSRFESRQFVAYPQFIYSLDWALKMARDTSSFDFAIAALHLENTAALNGALGVQRAADLLEACGNRLRESLADVELIARVDHESFLMLLPGADRKRLPALAKTVDGIASHAVQNGSVGPAWRLAEQRLDARSARQEDAHSVLQRLYSKAGISQRVPESVSDC
jgi:GGDEF domain-containing protein